MIHKYFAEIQEKLTEIKSLIRDSSIEFRTVSSEMGIIKGILKNISAISV